MMGNEDHRHIQNTDSKLQCSTSNELLASNSTQKKYRISLKPADVAILHPSFLCPILKQPADELRIIVLTDSMFFNTYEKAPGKEDKKAGPALSGAVNRFLKIVSWASIDKTCHADAPVFDTIDEAKANIEVYHLWDLADLDNYKLSIKDKEKTGDKLFAQIHPEVLKMYKDKGLNHGFEIIIKDLPQDNGLYDISWMNYAKPETEDETGYFYELQDGMLNDYNSEVFRKEYHPLKCDVRGDDKPVFSEEKTEIQSYHPLYISKKTCLDIGQLSDVHISSRQHVFTQSKARLIDGKEGDHRSDEIGGMVNTSYATLKNLMAQMGKDIDLLIFTGDLIDYNRNFNPDNSKNGIDKLKKSGDIWKALNLDRLTDKQLYPIGIDNLVMYELFKWYYGEFKKPIMLVSGNHEAYTLPYGISPRIKKLRSALKTYGIWNKLFRDTSIDALIKRNIEQKQKDQKKFLKKGADFYDERANEGIPADHNLTISEAVLMYGSDYARVVMSASYDIGGERNFRPENMDWFHHVFTPLTSYITNYTKQSFIGLGWGEDERFLDHIPKKQGVWKAGGFLPRSVEGVTVEQLEIIEQGLEENKTFNILCSHFTYINYDTSQPINKDGKIDFLDNGSLSLFDYGTFEKNRNKVYSLLKGDKIHYTLSGHSHRSGLYQIEKSFTGLTGYKNQYPVADLYVKGQAAKNNIFKPNNGCRILVASCGGPIAVQNHNNELYNWGLDTPSGNAIKFNGSSEAEIGIIKTVSIGNANPRLAVALDYADIFLREKEGIGLFSKFESSKRKAPLSFKINPTANLPDTAIFDKMSLVLYLDDGEVVIINGSIINQGNNEQAFQPDNRNFFLEFDDSVERFKMGFIKIKLKASTHSLLSHYNTDSDWVYPIQFFSQQALALALLEKSLVEVRGHIPPHSFNEFSDQQRKRVKKDVQGYVIQRHDVFGEVPEFDWYRENFPHEFF